MGLANGPAAPGQKVAQSAYVPAPTRWALALLKVSTVQPAPSAERPAATQSVLPSGGAT